MSLSVYASVELLDLSVAHASVERGFTKCVGQFVPIAFCWCFSFMI